MRFLIVIASLIANLFVFLLVVAARYGWPNMINPPVWRDESQFVAYWSVYAFGASGLLGSWVFACLITAVVAWRGRRGSDVLRVWVISLGATTLIASGWLYWVAIALRGM